MDGADSVELKHCENINCTEYYWARKVVEMKATVRSADAEISKLTLNKRILF